MCNDGSLVFLRLIDSDSEPTDKLTVNRLQGEERRAEPKTLTEEAYIPLSGVMAEDNPQQPGDALGIADLT